jgi:hypothetical protein
MIYITEMLRWGDDESHHYILGVYSTREGAQFAGEVEKSWRGGKYDYRVVPKQLDAASGQDQYEHHMQCT